MTLYTKKNVVSSLNAAIIGGIGISIFNSGLSVCNFPVI